MTRWITPLLLLALGTWLVHLSLRAHAHWRVNLAEGDLSGAEAYEMEFWPEFYGGLALIAVGAFLAGRRLFRDR